MQIIIYTAKREKPFVFGGGTGATLLSLSLLLLAGAFWSGSVYGRKAARLSKSLESLHQQSGLIRGSLAVADSAAEKARLRLATADNQDLEPFMRRIERMPLSHAQDTVAVNRDSGGSRFMLQISSFNRRAEAEGLAASLGRRLARPVEVAEVQVRDSTWFRVMIGHFPSRYTARGYGDSLSGAGVIREFIVQEADKAGRRLKAVD